MSPRTLAIVEFFDGESHKVRYLRRLFQRSGIASDCNGASANFSIDGLLKRAEAPK